MISKQIHSQDSFYKIKFKKSGETSLNLSNELRAFIAPDLEKGDEQSVTFRLYREDFVKAACYIICKLPLFKSSSKDCVEIKYDEKILTSRMSEISTFFGLRDTVAYTVNIMWRNDGRIYLNNLKQNGFSLRNYLIEDNSTLVFDKIEDEIVVRLKSGEFEDEDIYIANENEYIERYKHELPSFWNDEMYKWIAVKHFQENWDIDAMDFGVMFKEATRKHTNLLDTINNYPIAQILDFDKADPASVRNMFKTLYDESLDLSARIEYFKSESKRIQATNPEWKTNYQDLRAISVYLMFRYPEKYFIYKYKELKIALQRLGIDFSFKGKTEPQFLGNVMEVMRGISEQLKADSELVSIIEGLKTSECYDDKEFHIDAVDFVFYLGKRYVDTEQQEDHHKSTAVVKCEHIPYINALRTKPFMLLAGISGTGKSRIVREFAFASCPKELQDKDKTTPGNYCMIEVKPNWHDSSELLGYYSNISKKYNYSKFVKFLVKAMHHKNTPFFVCLDEMNLAPVEQYFAEFLSVLETRKKTEKGIVSGSLVDKKFFSEIYEMHGDTKNIINDRPSDNDWYNYFWENEDEAFEPEDGETYNLMNKGLCLPENVFIIGTVNMDDTTHQFSRKVIDRAMTIEMNGGDLKDMFGGSEALTYPIGDVLDMDTFRSEYVNADEVIERHSEYEVQITTVIPQMLDAINEVLANTPFQVSYRVLNELVIYLGVLLDKAKENESDINFNSLGTQALDAIMLMKILPRIEGDSDMFALKIEVTLDDNGDENHQKTKVKDRINWLKAIAPSNSKKKLEEMHERLMSTEFTRFWP